MREAFGGISGLGDPWVIVPISLVIASLGLYLHLHTERRDSSRILSAVAFSLLGYYTYLSNQLLLTVLLSITAISTLFSLAHVRYLNR